jgi:hypothetical protein
MAGTDDLEEPFLRLVLAQDELRRQGPAQREVRM